MNKFKQKLSEDTATAWVVAWVISIAGIALMIWIANL